MDLHARQGEHHRAQRFPLEAELQKAMAHLESSREAASKAADLDLTLGPPASLPAYSEREVSAQGLVAVQIAGQTQALCALLYFYC